MDRLLREILLSNPLHGPVQLIKVDLSDGFYRLCLNIEDIPKLGVTFPSATTNNLVAFPLVLPMGWKNSPPAFCTATETIADLANQALRSSSPSATFTLIRTRHPNITHQCYSQCAVAPFGFRQSTKITITIIHFTSKGQRSITSLSVDTPPVY